MGPIVKRSCRGLVLAGGASRRMGSRKERLELDGEPLLLRTVRCLLEVAGSVAVVTDARQTYPFLPRGVQLLRDEEADCGPIGGICTGMRLQSAELLLVTGCDYPLMQPQLWRRLIARMATGDQPGTANGEGGPVGSALASEEREAAGRGAKDVRGVQRMSGEHADETGLLHTLPDAIVPRVQGRLHPLCAVYHRRTLPLWKAALAERELRVMRVLDRMHWVAYEAEGAEADAFLNMNTPEEFIAVRKQVEREGGGWHE